MMPQQPAPGTYDMSAAGGVQGIFPRHHLTKDEVVLYEARPNLLPFLIGPLISLILVVIIGGIFVASSWIFLEFCLLLYVLFIVIMLVGVIVAWLKWNNTYYAASNKRVMTQTGIFGKNLFDCSHDKIQNVTVVQPFLERIFGYGTVMFATSGMMGGGGSIGGGAAQGYMGGGAVIWGAITSPMEVRRRVQEIIDDSIKRNKQQEYMAMAGAMAAAQQMAGGMPAPGYGQPAPGYGAPPAYAPQAPAANCRYCGAQVPPGSQVCPRCGGRL